MKNKIVFSFLFVLFSALANAQSYNGPESIEYDTANNRYLVGNSSNGQIIARDASGNLTIFKSGISPDPYGLEIVGNTIYACCGGRIKGYDLTTAAEVFNVNLSATFLNGITSDGSGYLFTTDFSAKKIYRVNIATQGFNVMASNLVQSPNGIIYDGTNNRLVFVNWGNNAPIKQLMLTDSSVSNIITTTFNNCDGIATDYNGNWFISNWENNSIVQYDDTFLNPVEVLFGLDQPADIYYNTMTDTLAVPNSGNNTVSFMGFNQPFTTVCSDLPLTINADSISFGDADFTADSMIRIVIKNESGFDFAYPIALIEFLDAFPAGMTLDAMSQGQIVFGSSWNDTESLPIKCYFDVTTPLPDNYMLRFILDITNLDPSPVDTCYFVDTFSVNLHPAPTGIIHAEENDLRFSVYPNPAEELCVVSCELCEKENSVLAVINSLGQEIYSAIFSTAHCTLPTVDWSAGIYFVQLISADGTTLQSQKLVVK